MTDPTPHPDRLQQLEESVGFTDRRADELHEQLISLHAALQKLVTRLDRLEGRLGALESTAEQSEDAGDADVPGS